MKYSEKSLRKDEELIFKLKYLYENYGYKKFKMSKFEEYDLYLENKKFLLSDNIITFNDHNGKLLALKPDITLSIVKNAVGKKSLLNKVYYSENVYRSSKDGKEIKEIMQMGVEYIGPADIYSMSEVLFLAVKSLESVSEDYILGISNMGILSGLLEGTELNIHDIEAIQKSISNKNAGEIARICDENNINGNLKEGLISLAEIYGPFESVIADVEKLAINDSVRSAVDDLKGIYSLLNTFGVSDKVMLDFSIMNDMSYYNGIIFQGFIDKIPSSVLSGGRYDNLVKKMGQDNSAIGFALYLDQLERFFPDDKSYDVDALIIYENEADFKTLTEKVKEFTDKGLDVRVQKEDTGDIKYKEKYIFRKGGLKKYE